MDLREGCGGEMFKIVPFHQPLFVLYEIFRFVFLFFCNYIISDVDLSTLANIVNTVTNAEGNVTLYFIALINIYQDLAQFSEVYS